MSGLVWRRRCGAAGDCVEVGWRKSSRSLDNGNCVEVKAAEAFVFLRDSKDPDGPVLGWHADAWAGFLAAITAGELTR